MSSYRFEICKSIVKTRVNSRFFDIMEQKEISDVVDPTIQTSTSDQMTTDAVIEKFDDENECRLLVLYTGGTIGMRNTDGVYVPAPNYLVTELRKLPMFHDKDYSPEDSDTAGETGSDRPLVMPLSKKGKRVIYTVWEYDPLLDSCNMTMADWAHLALDIKKNYQKYDGFVILHGTDTMAYTASALSFMLENLGKPVIVTGSQIPIFETRSDGRDNFLGALIMAGHYCIPEVTLYFHNKLLRGNRASKVDAGSFDAFDSPNLVPLAQLEIDITVNWNAVFRPSSLEIFQVHVNMCPNVGLLCLFPSITLETVEAFLRPPMEGVVIQTYGAGNGPDSRQDLLTAFTKASRRGVIIINITQCSRGGVSPSYATGKALLDAGIILGGDMTPEAALTKLSYVLGKDITAEEKKAMVSTNLKGEMRVVMKTSGEGAAAATKTTSLLDFPLLAKMKETMRLSSEDEVDMLKDAIFPSLLCSAAREDNMEALETLTTVGAQVTQTDYDGRTALHVAASEGHQGATVYLLENGALVHQRDRYGRTALDDAIHFNHHTIIKMLRKTGAHLNVPPFRLGTLLCNATIHRKMKELNSWVLGGADINQGDYDSRTALHVAACQGDREMVALLLSFGANVNVRDITGRTPSDEASKRGFADIVRLIQDPPSSEQ